MKPNPCKWCGAAPIKGYKINTLTCLKDGCSRNFYDQDFPTWQKNNPLPIEISAMAHSKASMEKFGIEPPHQFKVGDWVNTPSGKGKVGCVQGKRCFVAGESFRLWFNLDEITPATRLKRKEIRERLELLQVQAYNAGCGDGLVNEFDNLLEDI